MQNKGWTIIVGFGKGFKSYQFFLSRKQLFASFLILLSAFSLLLGMVIKSRGKRGDLSRYALLKGKKESLLSGLRKLSQEIDSLKGVTDAWANLDRGVRIMSDMKILDAGVRALGVGGRSYEEDPPPLLLDRAAREELINLDGSIGQLQREVAFEEESFKDILKSLTTQKDLLAHTPSIMPVAGRITSGFGWRHSSLLRRKEFHKGLDIANRPGTPIFAPADGVVVYEGWKKGFGRLLTIDHGYGYKTRYGHLRRILVRVGQRVRRGEIIAQMGNTGRSTGPHLHYEVLVLGTHVNPKNYIAWEFTQY